MSAARPLGKIRRLLWAVIVLASAAAHLYEEIDTESSGLACTNASATNATSICELAAPMAPAIKSIHGVAEDEDKDRKAIILTPHPGDEALLHVKKQWVDQLIQYAQMKGYTAVLQASKARFPHPS